ncbi:MAG: hypothetical protein ACT4RN_09835 [Pseudonocardia sp.]
MNELDPQVVMPALTAHLVDALNPLLPAKVSLIDAGAQVVLVAGTSPPRTVSTHTLTIPEAMPADDLRRRADYLLGDLQDLVVSHLHAPWPITAGGRTTYTAADVDGDRIQLAFVSADGVERIDLPDFVVPSPGRTVVAG